MQAHRTAKFVPVFVRTAAILGMAIALFSTGTATAQRPGGFQRPGNNNQGEQNDTNRREGERTTQNRGPGGVFQFGRQGSQGVMGTIFRQEAQQDAGLTPELVSKITEVINAQQQQNPDDFRLIGEQMRNAQSDEERAALRDEMSKMFAERAKQTEEEIAKVVSPEQMTRLRQLTLQFDGARALQQETVVKDLKISEEQETKIAELLQQQGEAWRELGFRASPEERQALEREWTGKIFSVLTPEQQATWNQKVGTVITTNGIPGSPAAPPAATPRTTSAAPNRAITTDIGSTVIRPDGDSQQVLASFDAASTAKTATESPATTAPATTPPADAASEVAPAAAPRVVGFRTLPQASKEKVSFNFRYAPWADVLKQFASLAGLTLDLTTAVPGTFNYYDQGEYTPLEALDILNGYLIQKGYTLLRRDQFLVVINMDNGIPPNLIELIPVSELPARGRFEFLKIRMAIKGITADVAAKEVEALLGSHGTVVPMRTSNSLLITDIGDNLRAITQLLSDVATQEDPAEVIFQQIIVKYLDVEDAEQMLRTQFGLNVAANVSAFTGDDRRRSSDTSVNTATGSIKISSDVRTQSLLVTAPRSQIALMEAFLQAVDIDIAGDGSRSASQNQKPFLRSYTLKTASAREVSKTLTALLPPGMVINEDGEAQRVHIFATESEHAKVAEMINGLDTDSSTVAAEVYFLSKTDPVGAASMLESLFIAEAVPPVIKADTFGRSLIIRGSFEQMAQIKKIMLQLGEDGTGVVADDAPANPFLRISIGDRDATEVLNLFERSWKQSEPTPIRIVIPAGTRDPIKQELVPSATSRTTSPAPAPTPVPRPASLEGGRQAPATTPAGASVDDALLQFFLKGSGTSASHDDAVEEVNEDEAERQDLLRELERRLNAPPAPPQTGLSDVLPGVGEEGVTIINQGDSLLLYSNDPAKLKRAQELIQAIGMALPPRPSWTLFYLRTTDATEVAYMLEQLIPDSSVSSSSMESDGSLFGGLTNQLMGLGETLASSSGLSSLTTTSSTLRIIPETRLNALFVTGPSHLVAEVEQFLKYLDATELPESLRDRVPRAIDVHHADVNEVYDDVRSLYAEMMTSTTQQAQNNPLAMLMMGNSGNRGNRGNTRTEMAKLALGIDEKSSRLLVSANESLFREIEQFVTMLDESARDSKPSMHVFYPQYADPLTIQQTLTSVMPRVKIATAGERTSRTESRTDSPSAPQTQQPSSNRGNDNQQQQQDAIRRMMEQRMQGQQPGATGQQGFSPFGQRGSTQGQQPGSTRGRTGNFGRGR